MTMKLCKSIVVYLTNRSLQSSENESFPATHINTNEFQNHKHQLKNCHQRTHTIGYYLYKGQK